MLPFFLIEDLIRRSMNLRDSLVQAGSFLMHYPTFTVNGAKKVPCQYVIAAYGAYCASQDTCFGLCINSLSVVSNINFLPVKRLFTHWIRSAPFIVESCNEARIITNENTTTISVFDAESDSALLRNRTPDGNGRLRDVSGCLSSRFLYIRNRYDF